MYYKYINIYIGLSREKTLHVTKTAKPCCCRGFQRNRGRYFVTLSPLSPYQPSQLTPMGLMLRVLHQCP